MSPVRRLAAVALIAAGLALELSLGAGLIAAGIGLGWSGVELPVLAVVKRRHAQTRRKGSRTHASRASADGPATASTGYGEAAA